MTNKLLWYINRAKSISFAEWGYRLKQQLKNKKEKFFYKMPAYNKPEIIKGPDVNWAQSLFAVDLKSDFHFFNTSINIEEDINFHLDPTSGKLFPKSFAKDINMRSDKYGSAKVVWEINRLQFLLPLLINYRITGDVKLLERFVKIVKQWDSQNQYLKGVNWYSNIEINIRLINFYWCWLVLEGDVIFNTNPEYKKFVSEIWLPLIHKHCYYSANNPSYYSSANNHLISEYAGLFIATSLWKFKESNKWHTFAKEGLEREIILQHSVNGVNKEEAAEYIQFITDFFLLSYVAADHFKESFSNTYISMLKKIVEYINVFLDQDYNFPKYGDEDDGRLILPDADTHSNNFVSILTTSSLLFKNSAWHKRDVTFDIKSALLTAHINGYAGRDFNEPSVKDVSSVFYEDEGHFYFKGQNTEGKEVYAHFDAAPLGFLSIAAHGHFDALSFFLTLNGKPFLVDPGTYTYHTHPEWRKYFVSAMAHNTIVVDEIDQAKLAGPTLWLDHYKCNVAESYVSPENDYVAAGHDGYKKIGVLHKRNVNFNKKALIFDLSDEVEILRGEHKIIMPFHLHPDVRIEEKGNNVFVCSTETTTLKLKMEMDPDLNWKIVYANDSLPLGWYSKSFMQKELSSVLLGSATINKDKLYKTTFSIF